MRVNSDIYYSCNKRGIMTLLAKPIKPILADLGLITRGDASAWGRFIKGNDLLGSPDTG